MGWQVEGIDLDPLAVETAQSRGFSVKCGTIALLNDASERYDVITLSHVIEHVYDPLGLLRSLYRLLKPGGRLWLETPNLDSLGHARFGPAWRGLEPPRHLVLFNSKSLPGLIALAGFSRQRTLWRGMMVYSVFAESEAIEKSRDVTSASRKGRPPVSDFIAECSEMINPTKREFITLVARKP